MRSDNFRNIKIKLFILLFSLSGYGRFSSEFLISEVSFPFPISFLIDQNRLLIAIIILCFFAMYGAQIFLKIKRYSFYISIIALHLLLATKLFLAENNWWYLNLAGAIFLMAFIGLLTKVALLLKSFVVIEKVFFSVICVWMFSVFLLYALGSWENIQHDSRFFFFSAHPNHAGSLWVFSAISCLFFFMNGRTIHRALTGSFFIISLYFIYLTNSRGASLSCALGIILILFQSIRSRYKILWISIVLILVLASITFGENLNQLLIDQVNRGNTRGDTYAAAINGFLSYPLFGIPIYLDRPTYVENTFLAFMQLGGIIGLLLVLFFYFYALKLIIRAYKIQSQSLDINTSYFLILFSTFIFSSMFEAYPLNFISIGSFATTTSAVFLLRAIASRNINNI